MQQLIKLDEEVIATLCCPLCKGALKREPIAFACPNCGTDYPSVVVSGGGAVYDFRIHRPAYAQPSGWKNWQRIQTYYEEWSRNEARKDDLQVLVDEIDSVREIYEREFSLEGRILDVGGHQGRLRHYLQAPLVPLFVVADPFIDVFHDGMVPNLAYPCLREPVNFVGAHAEILPFRSGSFDWVHMRSVVDHFVDPWLAFKEAWRVLRLEGRILVGVAIEERIASSGPDVQERFRRKLSREGVGAVISAVARRLLGRLGITKEDDHMWRLKAEELRDLFLKCSFRIVKEHWQKPPFSYVIYVEAQKVKPTAYDSA